MTQCSRPSCTNLAAYVMDQRFVCRACVEDLRTIETVESAQQTFFDFMDEIIQPRLVDVAMEAYLDANLKEL